MNEEGTYWQAELELYGQTIIDTPRRETAAEASKDAWERFHDLTGKEQSHAEAFASEWIETDGTGENTGRTVEMSQCGEAMDTLPVGDDVDDES